METREGVMDELYPVQKTEAAVQLFSADPETAFQEAQRIVNVVSSRCKGPGYIANIRGKLYPRIEFWTTVSASLGLFPRVVWARRLEREGEIAYEARVEVHRNGQIISTGEAMCSNLEPRWQSQAEYAIKSMAITRATGKAYRIPLSFLAVMAGLEPTPAEEMASELEAAANSPTQPATDKQLGALAGLLEDDRVSIEEKTKLRSVLDTGTTKDKASQIMEYYYGKSVLRDGEWVRVSPGVLANRGERRRI